MDLPILTQEQRSTLRHLEEMAQTMNRRVNLYSEASATDFWERHIIHSLSIGVHSFKSGERVVDWGTGGGMPGLPLAVLFPHVEFVLIDAVGKKIRAVQTIARRLGLINVTTWNGRAERWRGTTTYSVSRATSSLRTLWEWHCRAACPTSVRVTEGMWRPGLICLKGGDLKDEITDLVAMNPHVELDQYPLYPLLGLQHFSTKRLIAVYKRLEDETDRDGEHAV